MQCVRNCSAPSSWTVLWEPWEKLEFSVCGTTWHPPGVWLYP